VTTFQNQVAVEATIAEREWTAALGAVTEEIADCFERREPRAVVREMTEAMLMELDTRNCWTLAEALGHLARFLEGLGNLCLIGLRILGPVGHTRRA